jgi:hypothetical protein
VREFQPVDDLPCFGMAHGYERAVVVVATRDLGHALGFDL